MSIKAMNGTGPGAGVKDAIVKRDSDIAKDMAKLRAAEQYMLKHGWVWKGGKWV